MRALVCHEFAPYARHKIENLTMSSVPAGHVRIKVAAAGVNFPDILMAEGKYQFKPPFPFTPGSECAGTVETLDDDVKRFHIGDRVATVVMNGAFATYVDAPATAVRPIGDMPFEIAASLTLAYGTSYYALKDRGQLRRGEKLLVLGAAGGVGLAAVEIGRAMGATVIAAASTDEKLQVCKEHGADHLVNYSGEDLKAKVKALGGADVIYDPVGDKFAEPAFRALNWLGRYLVIGFSGGEIPKIPLNLALLKSADIRGVFWGAWTQRHPVANQKNMGELLGLLKNGKIKPRISNTYMLDDFARAFDELTQRRAKGKVVLTMDS